MEQALTKILTSSSELITDLIHKTQSVNNFTQLLHQFLEPEYKHYCRVANFRDQILILEIDNAACATQIRYRIPQLLTKLQQKEELKNLRAIEWFIRPAALPVENTVNTYNLTNQAADILEETASHIDNSALKNALYRLAKKRAAI